MEMFTNNLLGIKIPKEIAVIGIDSGSQGAFVLFAGKKKIYKKMPGKENRRRGILTILENMKQIAIDEVGFAPLVILEKVTGMGDSKGGKFTDGRLMQNFGQIQMAITSLNLKSIEIASITWKSNFGLKLQKWQKDFTVTQKKQITIDWLNTQLKDFQYPNDYIKQIGDAVAIAYWGDRLLKGKQYNVSRNIRKEMTDILLKKEQPFLF